MQRPDALFLIEYHYFTFFFFSSRRRHTRLQGDWSSDVCSSDLCAGEFQPLTHMADRELVQLVCAFRLMFPDAGLVLSTRESATLRDGLIPLGITMVSAGSHTEPGGYTGAGKEKLHHTKRGRIVELGASEWANGGGDP